MQCELAASTTNIHYNLSANSFTLKQEIIKEKFPIRRHDVLFNFHAE